MNIALLNSIFVYGMFAAMLTMGLCIDSTAYREQIGAGNILYLPFFLATYAIPNWIGVAILASMIGSMNKDTETPIRMLWRGAILSGLTIAAMIIFGGSYLNVAQVLTPTQDDYFKIVSLCVLAGLGQKEIRQFVNQRVNT